MIQLKHIAVAAAMTVMSAMMPAQAQFKLPDNHNKEHEDLLASQKPLSADIKVINTLKYISELSKVEMPDEAEVYGEYWESASVNPYV
ncbi:MAG: hypothetical protein K1V67_00575, partial [Paramuribaculum intestinale]